MRMKEHKKDLLKIVDFFGRLTQRKKFSEEQFEFLEAEATFDFSGNLTEKENLESEVADVIVMLYQFVFLHKLDERNINHTVCYKIKRTLEKIKKMQNLGGNNAKVY